MPQWLFGLDGNYRKQGGKMRLWHKDLIEVLPRQQLLGQWRECCLIAKNIAEQGKPNHLLVNRIMDFPLEHFYSYAKWVEYEMKSRRYKCDFEKFEKWYRKIEFTPLNTNMPYQWLQEKDLFPDWHNINYLQQCYFNLAEKHDCGGISDYDFKTIDEFYEEEMIADFQNYLQSGDLDLQGGDMDEIN